MTPKRGENGPRLKDGWVEHSVEKKKKQNIELAGSHTVMKTIRRAKGSFSNEILCTGTENKVIHLCDVSFAENNITAERYSSPKFC